MKRKQTFDDIMREISPHWPAPMVEKRMSASRKFAAALRGTRTFEQAFADTLRKKGYR